MMPSKLRGPDGIAAGCVARVEGIRYEVADSSSSYPLSETPRSRVCVRVRGRDPVVCSGGSVVNEPRREKVGEERPEEAVVE